MIFLYLSNIFMIGMIVTHHMNMVRRLKRMQHTINRNITYNTGHLERLLKDTTYNKTLADVAKVASSDD